MIFTLLKDNKKIIGYTLLKIFFKNKFKKKEKFFADTHILDKNYRNKYFKNVKLADLFWILF